MRTDYTLPLSDLQASLVTVGGKGASLARLARAGLPVPDGFYVSTAAYDRFVSDNDLLPSIIAALEAVDVAVPETLEETSRAIGRMFAQAPMPADIAAQVSSAYAKLPGSDPAVAVRSSATAEDLPGLSFAGQQETYLNITGTDAMLEAVKKCWASLWTARAISYRIRHDIDQQTISLAVVVQVLVPAEAAGILFTANPVTGQRGQMMISAAWGLGEAIVGGLVTPDTLTMDKATRRVLSRETADKEVMTLRANGGTVERPVPEDLRRAPVLDDETAAELVRLGAEIEQLYDCPMDIEWTLTDGQLAIVQARPITALPETEAPAIEWTLPDPHGYYMRASIVDLMPDPLTPLFETLGMRSLSEGLQRLVAWIARSERGLSMYTMATINGYAYMNAKLSASDWPFLLFRFVPRFPYVLRHGKDFWRETACVQYAERTARWEQKAHNELPARELLTGVREIFDVAMDHLGAVMTFLGACAGSEGLLTRVYDKMVKREGDPPAAALVMGFDSAPVRGEKALYDLAQWCRAQPDLAAYLLATPGQQIAEQLGYDAGPQGVSQESWAVWRERFTAYLKEYGYSIYDMDFGKPLPADDPVPFLENCRMFLRGEGANPHERRQASAQRREATVHEALSRLKGLKLKLFRMALNWAQDLAPLREDGIANVGYGYPVLREMLFEIGQRLAKRGALATREDVFWLREDELDQAVTALDADQPIDNFSDAVEQRKATWRARKAVTPPPQLPAKERYMGMKVDLFLAHGEQVGDTIKGVAASPGQVKAPARVLHGPEDFSQMQPGDVLVASITTPAWTPLFAMAAAVVTDIGGPLSHGSIVAREYGIPAVLGTSVATRRIHSGQIIMVNGTTGEVILSENGDSAT